MGIRVITEQQPDRESRLVLSQQKDSWLTSSYRIMEDF